MTFALDQDPTTLEISDAINYLLANLTSGFTANQQTGQVFGPGGSVTSYLYKYLSVKYADSFDGTVNFVNTPTDRLYYGLRNSDSSIESTNPADYVWYKVTGGFSTNKFLYYTVTGGRRIDLIVAMAAPSALWQPESGTAIDLDVISSADGASSRICYAKSTSFALSSIPSTYQTSGKSSFPPYNTWGGSETWQATPPTILANEALFQSDGIYNPLTDLTTWNAPYLSNLKVGALSAITANLGSITAGSLNAVSVTSSTIQTSSITAGSSPSISGTGMTGSGINLYNDGKVAIGNNTSNVVWNNSGIYIQGNLQSANYSAGSTGWQILNNGSAEFNGVVVSRNLLIASGTLAVYQTRTYMYGSTMTFRGATYYALDGDLWINTGIDEVQWGSSTSTFVATAGLNTNGITVWYTGTPGIANFLVEVEDISYEWLWNGGGKIWIKVKLWVTPTGGVNSFALNYYGPGGIDWNLYKVT